MRALFCLILFITTFKLAAQVDFDSLRFVTVNEPPANYLSKQNELSGYSVEIIRQLQQKLGVNQKIEVMPEARAMHTLDNYPNVVMFSITRNAEREDKYHWLAHVLSKRWIFFSKHDSLLDASSLEQIIDSRIGVVRGDVREGWLKQKGASDLASVVSYDSAIKMLLSERIELLLYESFGVYSSLKKLGYRRDAVKPQYVAKSSDVYIVMSKFEGSEQIASQLQSALKDIMTSKWHEGYLNAWVNQMNEIEKANIWIHNGIVQY